MAQLKDSYLRKFHTCARELDHALLREKHIEVAVGVTLDSVYLKLYKKAWTNDQSDPVNASTRIFFSIWVNEDSLSDNRLYYNIHAFKMRQLAGYKIASRAFAHHFREAFKPFHPKWEKVSVDFGPLTLMQGWRTLENETLEKSVQLLARNFLEIAPLIDQTMDIFKRNDHLKDLQSDK